MLVAVVLVCIASTCIRSIGTSSGSYSPTADGDDDDNKNTYSTTTTGNATTTDTAADDTTTTDDDDETTNNNNITTITLPLIRLQLIRILMILLI